MPMTVALKVNGAMKPPTDWMPVIWPGPAKPDICIPPGPKARAGRTRPQPFTAANRTSRSDCAVHRVGFRPASEAKLSSRPAGAGAGAAICGAGAGAMPMGGLAGAGALAGAGPEGAESSGGGSADAAAGGAALVAPAPAGTAG